jgi:hypothetical protein
MENSGNTKETKENKQENNMSQPIVVTSPHTPKTYN